LDHPELQARNTLLPVRRLTHFAMDILLFI
jgi:hypothetical protein